MTLPLAKLEGKYEILEKIQEGGMGAIYKVRHLLLDEIRVVKVMKPQLAVDEKLKRRFINEAKLAKRLRAGNIAQLYDFVLDEDGVAYIVMEYIDGVTLQEMLRHSGTPTPGFAVELSRQGLRALSCLHHEGMVHRDIASDNLMVTKNFDRRPLVKLIDLGIAKDSRASDGNRTEAGTFLGKARYSAPEQFSEEGSAALGPRSDLYSFGVLMYELLTGVSPIGGKSFSELVASHLFRPPKSFDKTDPEGRVDPGLRALVMQALEKDPANRMGSAEELSDMLAPFQSDSDHRDELEQRLAECRSAVEVREQSDPGSSQSRLKNAFPAKKTTPPAPSYPRPVSDDGQEHQRQVVMVESAVRELLKAGKLDDAEAKLTSAVAQLGQDPALDALRRKLEEAARVDHERRDDLLRQAREHSDIKSEVRILLDQGKIEEAERRLAEAEEEHRKQAALQDRSQERSDRAREALAQNRFHEARGLLVEALEIFPENEHAQRLQAEIPAREKRFELEKTCTAISGELDSDRLDEAAHQLEAAERQYGGEPELARLRTRLERVLETKRQKAIDEVVGSVDSEIQDNNFDSAEQRLDAAISEHGSDPRFVKLRSELEQAREAASQQVVAEAAGAIRQLLETDKLDEAQRQLQSATAELGRHRDLEELESRLTELRREKAHREAVAGEIESVLGLLSKEKLKQADKRLKRALAELGDDQALTDLRSKVDTAVREQERRLETERSTREAEARERKERKTRKKPREPDTGEFTTLRRQLDAARAKKRQAAIAEVHGAVARADWKEAQRRLDAAVSELGAHVEFDLTRAKLDAARKAPAGSGAVDRTMVRPRPADGGDAGVDRTMIRPTVQTATPVEQPRRRIVPIVGAVAALLVIAAGAWWFLGRASEGTLVLDATPGTQITAIVGEDGSSHLPGRDSYTPLSLQLGPGRYTVSLAFANQGERNVEVEIRASETTAPEIPAFTSELSAAEYFEQERVRAQESP